jgi:hypothetical protein
LIAARTLVIGAQEMEGCKKKIAARRAVSEIFQPLIALPFRI